jgi:uncharacterized membrane protein YdjX (TVP38/TMEM64 family)
VVRKGVLTRAHGDIRMALMAQRAGTLGRAFTLIARSSFFWTLVAVGSVGIAGRMWMASQSDPASAVRSFGVMAPLASLVLQTATMMTPVGTSAIPVLNGMLFPLTLAVTLNLAAGLAGGTVMYYVFRRGEREIGIQRRVRAMPRWTQRFARTDLLSLVVLRMLPWAGGSLATVLAATHGVPLRIHLLAVFLGSIPGSVIYALFGAGIIAR